MFGVYSHYLGLLLFGLLFLEAVNQIAFNFPVPIKFSRLWVTLLQQLLKKLWQEFETFSNFLNFIIFPEESLWICDSYLVKQSSMQRNGFTYTFIVESNI